MTDTPKHRAPKGDGSWRTRADGREEWRGTIGEKRQSIYGATRAEVVREREKRKREAAQGKRENRETVEAYLVRWLAMRRPYLEYRSWLSYEIIIRKHIVPAIGARRLDRLTVDDVQTLLSGLLRAGYAPATAGHVRTMLRAALNALVRQGDLSRNVASLVDVPAREHEARPLTPDEATAFLRALRGEPLEALFTVALAAGLRVGEATGLRWQDVNLDTGAVWLRVQIQRQDRKDVLKSLKSDRSRQFVLPAFAIAALVRHHEKHAATPRNPWGLIFTTAKGAPVSTQYLSWRLRRILDDAKIPRRTMHDLRHSAISILIAEGATPVEVAALAGHSSPAITMRVYAHAFATSKQRMADLMDKAMRQKEDKGFS